MSDIRDHFWPLLCSLSLGLNLALIADRHDVQADADRRIKAMEQSVYDTLRCAADFEHAG